MTDTKELKAALEKEIQILQKRAEKLEKNINHLRTFLGLVKKIEDRETS